ncbi:MAG: mechanosensitive ion channel family protein [Leptospiraceae bacterium]|nr:mechanosensitive ion channel family protein [Leptospiraceae bacterium]MCP5495339.1 mechanosensitive ion channel family protein [Leptospiraceae bacterium]
MKKKRLAKPILLVVVTIWLEIVLANYPTHDLNSFFLNTYDYLITFIRICLIFACAHLSTILLNMFLWEKVSSTSGNVQVPKLLTDGSKTVIYFVAILFVISFAFEKPISGFITASGAVGIVIGFALRGIIADIFSGLVLNLDKTFQMNDWIMINARGLETVVGCIVEINWRSTRLRTTDNTLVVLPNSLIAQNIVKNLSQPDERARFDLIFTLDFGVPYERAIRVLDAAVKSAEGILQEPPPKTRANNISHIGVEYIIRYWLLPSKTSPLKGRNAVVQSVLHHLHQAGLSLAYYKQDIFYAHMPTRDLDRNVDSHYLLARIDLFKGLTKEEIDFLAKNIQEIFFKKGEAIVKKGDNGLTMYILVEGLLHVYLPNEENEEIKVGEIIPGNFFGEMSLLTGEARTASIYSTVDSVLFEVKKETMNYLISKRPALMEYLSQTIAKRQTLNKQVNTQMSFEEISISTDELTKSLLSKMKGFFNIF